MFVASYRVKISKYRRYYWKLHLDAKVATLDAFGSGQISSHLT
jgi:hypothetical protein